jgi:TRAP-type C4-dicarboxylate transport system permease small subunit
MKRNVFAVLDGLLRSLCAALMGAMAAAVILSVFFRYVFSITTVWSEELITVLFIATSLLGTAMVARDNEHISVDFIYEVLPPRAATVLRIFVSMVVIAVMIAVFRFSLPWIAVTGSLRTPGLDIPFQWVYALLPASCVLVCLVEFGKIVSSAVALVNGESAK